MYNISAQNAGSSIELIPIFAGDKSKMLESPAQGYVCHEFLITGS